MLQADWTVPLYGSPGLVQPGSEITPLILAPTEVRGALAEQQEGEINTFYVVYMVFGVFV